MYNSKYTGQQVEALLDSVSGKTIYTQGSGITIENGAIGVSSALTSDFVSNERFESLEEVVAQALISGDTPDMSGYYTSAQTDTLLAAKQDTLVSGTNIKTINNTSILGEGNIEISGGGSIDEDMYNGLQKAVAKILTDQKAKNKEIDTSLASKPSMSEIESQFVNNNELEAALVAFMRSDAYHAIHDPQEHAIAAGLSDLDSRVTTLEQDSGGTPVDLSAYYTSAETLNQIGIASAATMTAVSQAIENEHYLTSADTQNYLTSADTENFITSADTQGFVTETRFESLEETVANFMEAIPEESLVTTADTQNFITSADTQSFITSADTENFLTSADTQVYADHIADTSIHVTSAQTQSWDAKSDFSGSYNDLTDKPTIPTVPTNVSSFTNDAGYVTSAQTVSIAQFDSLEEAVANALISAVTQDDIKDFITSADTADFITSESLSGYTTAAQFTAHTENTDIHVTSADKTAWNAKSDFSGSYNDLTDKPTIPTVPSNVSDFNNDAGYITSADTENYLTSADTANFVTSTQFDSLEEAVANALISAVTQDDLANYLTSADTVNYYTSAETMTAIANASASTVAEASGVTMAAVANGYTPLSDMSNYYTKTQTDSAIATASGATVTAIEGMNYATTAVTSALESRIAALEALLLVTGVNSAYTVVQMTEAEYSAATKNANTIYYVTSGATA